MINYIVTLIAFVLGGLFVITASPDRHLSHGDLYRFCIVKEIPLDQCKIPEKYGKDV